MKNQQLYKLSLHFIKFSIVGVINTALNMLFFVILYTYIGIYYLVSQIICFFMVNAITFILNKKWTFNNDEKDFLQQFTLYIVGRALSLLVGLLFTFFLVEMLDVNPVWAQLYVTAIYIVLNFIWSKIVVFSHSPTSIDIYLQKSYSAINAIPETFSGVIYYIVPLYREIKRMQEVSDNNPSGEDFVRVKKRQLDDFFKEMPNSITWKLIFIDDCDTVEFSGKACENLVKKTFPDEYASKKIEVWYLDKLKPELCKTTQKGGSIIAAADKISRLEKNNNAIVFYTDADVSSNLAQSGLLLSKLFSGADVVVSSRWHDKSTVIGRKGLGKLSSWIYAFCVWLITGIDVSDTQNGFKAYRLEVLQTILPYLKDHTFSFDTEWLLLANTFGYTIEETELFWIDSVKESKVNTLLDSYKMLINLWKQKKRIHKLQYSLQIKA